MIGNFPRPEIRIRNPNEFGLATGISAIEIGIAEKASSFLTDQAAFGPVVIRVRTLAMSGQLMLTKKTCAAGNGEGNNYAIPFSKISNVRSGLFYNAHEFVPKHQILHL